MPATVKVIAVVEEASEFGLGKTHNLGISLANVCAEFRAISTRRFHVSYNLVAHQILEGTSCVSESVVWYK